MFPPQKLVALLLLPLAIPPAATREEVLARVRTLRNSTDYTASGRLVRVSPSGERKSFPIAFRAHAFPDGLRIFCEVSAPLLARVRLLLSVPSQGPATVRTGHSGDQAAKEIPAGSWGESLLGTDFTYEDLLENHLLWRHQTLLPEERYGARSCLVLRSEPGTGDQTQYTSVTTWLDREIYQAVKVEKVVKASREVRVFTYFGLRQVKGVWSASQIECKVATKPGSSLLIINRGTEKPHLNSAAFDPVLLTRP